MNDLTQPMADNTPNEIVGFASGITMAYVGNTNNTVDGAAVASFLSSIHSTLVGLGSGAPQVEETKQEPAVSVRKSLADDNFIICLEDGKKMKTLKRHIMTSFGLTPDQYRAKWGLASDYPMTARAYTEQRRALAKAIGLGTKQTRSTGGSKRSASALKTDSTTKRRGRPVGSKNKPTAEKAAA